MPIAFPSHQGLIAPLWRLWPDRFSVLALWVGAVMPDVIDGTENLAVRGHFQQWIGHSIAGATVVGVPAGLVLTHVVRRAASRLAASGAAGPVRTALRRLGAWIGRIDNAAGVRDPRARLHLEVPSVWLGALSHTFFDMLTHERSRLLWPFAVDPAWLGEWWRTAWFRVWAPGYPDYPIGPHFVAWLVLSIGGAMMFFRWPPRPRQDTP